MPLPAVVGLPWLAGVFSGLIAGIVAWFSKWMTRSVAVVAALLVVFAAITTGFYAAVYGIVQAVVVVSPPGFSMALGLFVPQNAYACVSAVAAVHVARWIYEMQLRVLMYKNPGAGF